MLLCGCDGGGIVTFEDVFMVRVGIFDLEFGLGHGLLLFRRHVSRKTAHDVGKGWRVNHQGRSLL